MKKSFLTFAAAICAFALVMAAMSLAGCIDESDPSDLPKEASFTSVADMEKWLFAQPVNKASAPYIITLKITDISELANLKKALAERYLSIDFSGSTIPVIPENAFSDCARLISISIPDSVESIENKAFSGCTGLMCVIMPDSVESIGNEAFSGCTRLVDIAIPNGVKIIGNRAFSGCAGLTDITIPNGVKIIGAGTFEGCTGLTRIIIRNGVTTIGSGAFDSCFSLERVIIPDSVTSIGNEAFYFCRRLASVTFQGTIASSGFVSGAFGSFGDLRDKFYATDKTNGTPGTYKTTAPVSSKSVWEKQ